MHPMFLKRKPEVINKQSSELCKQGRSRRAMHIDIRTLAAFGVTLLFWSSAFAGIRASLHAYTPAHIALLRHIVASVVLAGYAALTRMRLPHWRDIPGIALTGFVGITVYHVALNTGEVSVSAGVASFLIASAPIFLALLATTFLKERLRWWGWIGIALSFVGVTVIALGTKEGLHFDPGAFVVLVAAIAQSLYIIGQKLYLTRYNAFQFTTYAIWAGTLFLLVFSPGLVEQVRVAPPNATLAVVYLGIFPSAIAYVSLAYALARTSASTVASFLYLVPALALFIAWVWLGEIPTAFSLMGGILILSGVILVNTLGKART